MYHNQLKLSVVIPAYNEEHNLGKTVTDLQVTLAESQIPYEMVLVNDNSTDHTENLIDQLIAANPAIVKVHRTPPGGFGRAVRSGIEASTGEVIVICMADSSDDPKDVVAYYRKIEEGYDAVFGSRFIKGGSVSNYPTVKLVINRIVNKCLQWLFWCPFNDLTNAFKAYRRSVIEACSPYRACHFNITVEMSLGAIIRQYNIAQIPIHWYGRTWGSSNLSISKMGRRYLETTLKAFAERMLISDDLLAERLKQRREHEQTVYDLQQRVDQLEQRVNQLDRHPTAS